MLIPDLLLPAQLSMQYKSAKLYHDIYIYKVVCVCIWSYKHEGAEVSQYFEYTPSGVVVLIVSDLAIRVIYIYIYIYI